MLIATLSGVEQEAWALCACWLLVLYKSITGRMWRGLFLNGQAGAPSTNCLLVLCRLCGELRFVTTNKATSYIITSINYEAIEKRIKHCFQIHWKDPSTVLPWHSAINSCGFVDHPGLSKTASNWKRDFNLQSPFIALFRTGIKRHRI